MKKIYEAPELIVVTYKLTDVLSNSPTEDPFGEVIGGGGEGGDFDLGGGEL